MVYLVSGGEWLLEWCSGCKQRVVWRAMSRYGRPCGGCSTAVAGGQVHLGVLALMDDLKLEIVLPFSIFLSRMKVATYKLPLLGSTPFK